MATASLAIMSPQLYGDATLPVEQVNYIKPIAGALFDFSAKTASIDDTLPTWTSMNSNHQFASPSGAISQRPIVRNVGGIQYLEFDGSNDRMDLKATINGPFLIATAFKVPVTGAYPFNHGGQGPAWFLGTFGDSTKWAFSYLNKNINPLATPDTGWHVHLTQFNGANSSYKLDSAAPVTGLLDAGNITNLRIGATAGSYSKVHVNRFALIPGVISPARQQIIATDLAV